MSDHKSIILGEELNIEAFMAIVRGNTRIEFSQEYIHKVKKSRQLLEKWIKEEKIMYGITTGFGALYHNTISIEDAKKLQRNIILSHSTAVGPPLSIEQSRAVMLMILQSSRKGYTGIRLKTLELYKECLNRGVTPYAPKEGSVGYLTVEGHIALAMIGEGKAYYRGELLESKKALKLAGLKPIQLCAKEGLTLTNGTTSVTALGALALYDILNAVKSADIIASMTLESSKGNIKAFDDRIMKVRPHVDQNDTAKIIRHILKDSIIVENSKDYKLQDALSIRCVPQLHGAAKKTLRDAIKTIEIEMNSCCDNPIVWSDCENEGILSNGNPDSSYVGIEMDSACIAATNIAKMSERRNNRLIDGNLSENPWFLIKKPGLNSGLMIPQYTQAGLLNDMKILSHPATVDSIPTSGNQEDYVAMGYNASKKAQSIAEKLEYVLAIELLSAYQTYSFLGQDLKPSSITSSIIEEIQLNVPILDEDMVLYPYINSLRNMIHSGKLIEIAGSL